MKFSIQTLIWTLVVMVLIIVGLLALIPKPVEVQTAMVSEGKLLVTVEEDGKTRIREKYIVSTPVAGRLSRIVLKVGDEVCEDESRIAIILPAEPTMLDARSKAQAEARVDQAKATVKRAEAATKQLHANYEQSNSKYERLKKLVQSNAVSKNEYDIARSEFLAVSQSVRTAEFDEEIAKYELKMAEAALLQFSDNAKESAKPFEVDAPVCGEVLRVFQKSAAVINVGTPLIEVGDPQNLEIVIDVLSTDAVRIQQGSKIIIEHWGGKEPLTGTVRVVEPAAFTKISSLGVEEQRVNVIADFDSPKERLKPLGDGYRVEAKIIVTELAQVLKVPNSSLFRHQREWHVFKVVDDVAVMTPVKIGLQNDSFTEVVDGLAQDDEVILYPSDRVEAKSKIVRVK